MRKVFLDDLPKKKHIGKECVDWEKCIGLKVKFIYDNINGYILILNYNKLRNLLTINYKNNDDYYITYSSFLKCNLGKLLGVFTSDFKVDIGTSFVDSKRNITIINREYKKITKPKQTIKIYTFRCNICNWDKGWIEESKLLNANVGCSCCNGKTVVEGINDIPTTAPWMVKYFQGGYDEAKLYTKSSYKTINPICPDCGRVLNKKIHISNIYFTKGISCSCSDGISYPEKFFSSLMQQLKINNIRQFSKVNVGWIIDNKKYDFYINKINCIVEIHGGQHYKNGFDSIGGRTSDDEIKNDLLKENLAIQNGIKNYIIIDARYSDMEWIKNSIMNSKLPKLLSFNEEDINWIKCHEFGLSNLTKIVCDYKNNNNSLSTTDIGLIFNLCPITVAKYLKQGSILNWCTYDTKDELSRKSAKTYKKVEIYKNNISLGIFKSVTYLSDCSLSLFNVVLKKGNICNAMKTNKTYKGFTFKHVN